MNRTDRLKWIKDKLPILPWDVLVFITTLIKEQPTVHWLPNWRRKCSYAVRERTACGRTFTEGTTIHQDVTCKTCKRLASKR